MGLIGDLTKRQEEYRAMLLDLRNKPDKDFFEAVASSQGLDENTLVNVASVFHEMVERVDHGREPTEEDLIWSAEFLDLMDSLGMEVRFKQNVTRT